MNNLISIIVPIFKVEQYIDRCILSIINQSYTNLEIILVNDGSPDNCGVICDKYATTDKRIKVIHKENGGLSDARNAGIDIATGDYIGFVDSDDFIHPRMYEILFENLIKTDSDISICTFKKVYDNEPETDDDEANTILSYTNIETLKKLFTFYGVNFTVAWNKLYKKELFEGIRYPKGKIREDEFTTYKLIYKAKRIVETYKSMYYYFQANNSIMRNQSLKKEMHYADAIEERIRFFSDHNLPELHHRLYKRYCLWLLCSEYKNKKELKNEIQTKENLFQRRDFYFKHIAEHSDMNAVSRITFCLAHRMPFFFGLLAFHKLQRDNFVSRLASIMFCDKYSLK